MSSAVSITASRCAILISISAGAGNDAARVSYGSTGTAHNPLPAVTAGTGGCTGGLARGADNSFSLRFTSGKGLAVPFTRGCSRRLSTSTSDVFAGCRGTRRTGSRSRCRLFAAHQLTEFDIIFLRNLSPTHPVGAHLQNAIGVGRGVARNQAFNKGERHPNQGGARQGASVSLRKLRQKNAKRPTEHAST